MCNAYLWCDYFIWLAVHLNFILCATIHIHLVCKRHQDYCYCRGPLLLTLSLLSSATSLRLLCVDKTVPFFMPFRIFRPIVSFARKFVIIIIIIIWWKCTSFASILYFVLLFPLSYLFRCQLVFKCSQLPRY